MMTSSSSRPGTRCADAVVSAGEVQVNESLLTGESDEITKRKGDRLMSGSFIVSGQCHARLTGRSRLLYLETDAPGERNAVRGAVGDDPFA